MIPLLPFFQRVGDCLERVLVRLRAAGFDLAMLDLGEGGLVRLRFGLALRILLVVA